MRRMQKALPHDALVDAVWAAAKDGRWYTIRDLAKRVPGSGASLVNAVRFLLKYGFAEVSPSGGERFRMIDGCPPPSKVADGLRSIAFMGISD
jgi:hypothetical protein